MPFYFRLLDTPCCMLAFFHPPSLLLAVCDRARSRTRTLPHPRMPESRTRTRIILIPQVHIRIRTYVHVTHFCFPVSPFHFIPRPSFSLSLLSLPTWFAGCRLGRGSLPFRISTSWHAQPAHHPLFFSFLLTVYACLSFAQILSLSFASVPRSLRFLLFPERSPPLFSTIAKQSVCQTLLLIVHLIRSFLPWYSARILYKSR